MWADINTAPKDETNILVWDGHHISIAHWSYSFRSDDGGVREWAKDIDPNEYGMPLVDVGVWWGVTNGEIAESGIDRDLVAIDAPTHWMPLPQPPHTRLSFPCPPTP
jgi:hypothetical protein